MASFVTTAEFAAWLGKPEAEVDEVQASLLLNIASDAIRSYCGWPISQSVTTTVLDGSGSSSLWLPTLKLESVQSLTLDGVALVPLLDFVWSENGRVVRLGSWWPSGFSRVSVTYVHGFPDVPGAVKAKCLALAGRTFSNPDKYRSYSSQVGGVSESWTLAGSDDVSSGLTSAEFAELSPFCLPVVL